MSETIPEDIREKAAEICSRLEAMPSEGNCRVIAEALMDERRQWHRRIRSANLNQIFAHWAGWI